MRALRAAAFLAALAAAAVAAPAEEGILAFSPSEWRYGTVRYDAALSLSVEVSYSGPGATEVTFIPTCECLDASPRQIAVSAAQARTVTLRFDPAAYDGPTELDYIVRTTLPGKEKALYLVAGVVEGRPAKDGGTAGDASDSRDGTGDLRLVYYYSAGCKSCERFLASEIPRLERRIGRPLGVTRKDIFDATVFEEYSALVAELGVKQGDLPALLVGGQLLQGDREIRARVEEAIQALIDAGPAGPGTPGTLKAPTGPAADLRLLPVVAAGLLDGVNPCAFTTLVFLVSALAVAGRGRREVLAIGGFFTASVFVTYFAVGLGAFGALRAAAGFPVVAIALKWVLFAVLVVFGALSIYDYTVIRRGDPTKILLQLPTALKQRIHASIRVGARSAAMIASAVVMGFLVSVFELACTGQVYFPTIAYLVRARAGASSYLYLLLYNLGFIAPLVVVFALTFTGLTSRRLGELMRGSMGVVKLGLAALFFALAVLTVTL
jgi:cytochrome c biogenesis protein CcdA